jgi:hypothetical protein
MGAGFETHLFICRAGYEPVLCRELPARLTVPGGAAGAQENPLPGTGWVRWRALPGALAKLGGPLIFERQRLPHARWQEGDDLATLAVALAAAWGAALGDAPAWTLHAFAPNPDAEDSRSAAAQWLERRLKESLAAGNPALGGTFVPAGRLGAQGLVLQVCRVAGGVWSSLASPGALSDPHPGGVHRMANDPLAPSRSYLKLEEALEVGGLAPRPNETVVDLGAAPGGWSYAFAKRGCRVWAVDNGPLKLKSLGDMGGEVAHLREDGQRFRPAGPVDWMVSDMLVAPGQTLGLLRRWLGAGWMRRFIVNVKLPQAHPFSALDPIEAYLRGVPGLRYRLRQLYHDRREVTLMGWVERPPGARPAPKPGPSDGKPRRRQPAHKPAAGRGHSKRGRR